MGAKDTPPDQGDRDFGRSRDAPRDSGRPRDFDRDSGRPRDFDRESGRPRDFDRDSGRPRDFDRDSRRPRDFDRDSGRSRDFDGDSRRDRDRGFGGGRSGGGWRDGGDSGWRRDDAPRDRTEGMYFHEQCCHFRFVPLISMRSLQCIESSEVSFLVLFCFSSETLLARAGKVFQGFWGKQEAGGPGNRNIESLVINPRDPKNCFWYSFMKPPRY